ncbi:MAG: GHKL domain-containing protein [Lachnospiraceae bacterium]|nr:GHKL domain-containing protein [Lachnospiraceae bacterium]
MALICLLNDAGVSIFGGMLSASFCDFLRSRRRYLFFGGGMLLMLIPQGIAHFLWGAEFCTRIYPLIVHLPLVLLLYFLTRKFLWSAISVLSAYLFCQIRRWFALLFAVILPGGEITQELAELVITLPLLFFLLRFASPAVRQLANYPVKAQCQFGLIPALYYAFDYLTRIYTNLLVSGSPVVVEFMPFVCCLAYFVFLLYNSAEESRFNHLKQVQNNLNLQLSQAVREINTLRESQTMTIQYRHDLRHHMQYLSACIANGQAERAQNYISEICEEIEAQRVQRYCENEAANLLLSSFAGRIRKAGVNIDIQGALPAAIAVSDTDLCVLLSNSLENALHACQPVARTGESCTISVQFRLIAKTGRFFLQVTNPCKAPVRFEKGIPVSDRPNHGIGVQSICAIVERYGGSYTFLLENDQFILRLFL